MNGAVGQASILASSIDASAQSKHSGFNLQHRTLNSIENVQEMMGNKEKGSLIQIFDSIYYWRWDTISIGWKIDVKINNMVYDGNNNLISKVRQSWNGSTWENSDQYAYTYDANHNQTSRLIQNWNGNIWVNSSLTTDTFDANNNRTSELWQNWNSSIWVNSNIKTYTYDGNNFRISYSYRKWNNAGTVITDGDSTYYYFHTTLGINNLIVQGRGIVIYPNPATDKITIDTPANGSLTILNLNGQELLQQEITESTTTIDVSGLKSGVYFVRVTGKKGVLVGKFLKQ